ncbi:MAG: methionyl-tRNA formyltransferase [Blautia sp.]|nr:methionyl-tRNA formyltransferase [Blautia sp.]MCM1201573.1 methionyl-tRNA formyltransferase [Bacteroides fragilis]
MKIVYMGTPDFAVGALQALVEAGHEVAAVVTQPDKPKGRGKEMQMTPVKACALRYGIPVFQPAKVKTPEAVETLRSYGADVFVVAAFGQFLSEEILAMPRYGCINIHASLLPKYRGAAPIQRAILDGERKTGITIMQMDKGIDTGDILLQRVVSIDEKETGDSLHDKLAHEGAELIVEALWKLEAGELVPEKQDDGASCYAKMLDKSMGKIDWQQSAVQIERLVRGLNSWPGAYTSFHGKTLKLWGSEVRNGPQEQDGGRKACAQDGSGCVPGTITAVEKKAFYVQTGAGTLKVTEVQLEGKKRMAVQAFLPGCQMKPGETLV